MKCLLKDSSLIFSIAKMFDFQTYLLSDKVTGVMIFPDFEGSDGDYSSWQSDVYYGVTYLL